MPKRVIPVLLSEEEQEALLRLTRRHTSAQQLVLRARIVLAAGEGLSNAEIGRRLEVSVETVRLWRNRWVRGYGLPLKDKGAEERLADAPRPGVLAHISAEQRCQIELLACEAPSQSGRPISQWSGREGTLLEKPGRLADSDRGRLEPAPGRDDRKLPLICFDREYSCDSVHSGDA